MVGGAPLSLVLSSPSASDLLSSVALAILSLAVDPDMAIHRRWRSKRVVGLFLMLLLLVPTTGSGPQQLQHTTTRPPLYPGAVASTCVQYWNIRPTPSTSHPTQPHNLDGDNEDKVVRAGSRYGICAVVNHAAALPSSVQNPRASRPIKWRDTWLNLKTGWQ